LPKILTIEDDKTTAEEIVRELVGRGYDVDHVDDGAEGLRLASNGAYDAITLDRMLPGMDGLTVAETLRERGDDTPILMITAVNEVDERIRGLRAGGDDYLTKPFALGEMAARVEALLRRLKPDTRKFLLRAGDLELDLVGHMVRRAGRVIRLAPKESQLLEVFIRNAGQVLTRSMIFERVWGYSFDPGTNVIDVHILSLRRKLDVSGLPSPIITVRGEGYRFVAAA
jgi:two-component system OmpR family response regulator